MSEDLFSNAGTQARHAPLAETYPAEMPRAVPLRPSLDFATIARSVQVHPAAAPLR